MLGYKTAEKEVTTATFYPITLEDDSKLVDEVVVVGYGAVKKSDLTGSVASVSYTHLDVYKRQSGTYTINLNLNTMTLTLTKEN